MDHKLSHTSSICLISLSLFIALNITSPFLYASESKIEGKKIASIEIKTEGGERIEWLKDMISLKEGDLYSSRAVRKSLDQLYKDGRFKDITIDAELTDNGVVLAYSLIEKEIISEIEISGNWFVSAKELLEEMRASEGEEITDDLLREALSRTISYYHKKGFFRVEVEEVLLKGKGMKTRTLLKLNIREGKRTKIRALRFTGERVIPDINLLFNIKLGKGEFFSGETLARDMVSLENLYKDKGYFNAIIGPPDVKYDEESNEVDLLIPIEAGHHTKVVFEGNSALSSDKLEPLLLIEEERSSDDDVLKVSMERIEGFYKSKGYVLAKAEYTRNIKPEMNETEIAIKITEGKKVSLKEIVFEGNSHFSSKELKKRMELKEEGYLFSSILNRNELEGDMNRIQAMYYKNGFIGMNISEEVYIDETNENMVLILKTDEGVQTFVDRVEVHGSRLFHEKELLDNIPLEPGAPYSEAAARDGLLNILTLYAKMGYIYTKVDLKPVLRDDQKGVELIYIIDEDRPASIGRIATRGNDFTQSKVILRELIVHEGDPYDYEKILRSQQRIYQLGFFSDVRFEPFRIGEKDYTRDMVISVKEKKAGAVDFGIGYGDVERLRGFSEISQSNLFGTGRYASLRGDLSHIERKFSFNYKEPWVFSLPVDARLGLIDLTQKRITSDTREVLYELRQRGGTLGVDKSFTPFVKGSFTYQYEANKIQDLKPDAKLIPEDEGRVTIGSINLSAERDSRDDPFNPTGGSVNGILFKDAAFSLGSDVQFFKVTLQSSWYFPVTRWLVLALSGSGGVAKNFGETLTVPISERFFLGGRSSVRGYEQDSLGISGITIIDGTPTGGNAMLLVNGEFRISLLWGLGLVTFLDGGNVWPEYNEISVSEMKYSAGVGLRYNTPIGPIRLDLGYKLEPEPDESGSELHFTLGHTF